MKKNNFLLIALILLLTVSGIAQHSKKPLGIDDFFSIKRVSDPQLSPDGKTVALVVSEIDKNNNKSNRDIWLISLENGSSKKLTDNDASDSNPRWSPCGKKITFVSTRSGSPQIWRIPVNEGQAEQVTDFQSGVSGLVWSQDGKNLLFTSEVNPHDSNKCSCSSKEEKEDSSPIKAEIYDELLFRHWNSWRHGKRSHLFIVPAQGGKAKDITPGDYDTPPISLGGSQDYVFSSDGKSICFVRNIDPELKKGLGTNNDLFIRNLGQDAITQITTSKGNDNSPLFSPDGRYISYRAMKRPGFEADKYVLFLYDRSQKKNISLTNTLDRSVGEMLWTPDSKNLYFTCEAAGRMELYKISIPSGKIKSILTGHTIQSLSIHPKTNSLYFLKQTLKLPFELFCLKLNNGQLKQISFFNEKLLSSLKMNQAEDFWFKGANGDKVHGLMLKPPFFDPSNKYPLVMLIHGGPQGAWLDQFHYRWNAQMFASPGYVVAMINFHGSTGYGQDFTDSISGDWGGKPYKDIIMGLDYLLSEFDYIDSSKIGAAGASYGGYMINWIEGHSNRFNCLISHAGVFDLRSMYGATEELWFPEWEYEGTPWTNPEQYQKWSPSYFVQNFKTPCLVIHGQYDFRVPVTQGFQLFTALQRMNVPSKMLYYPDEYHFISKPKNAELWWNTIYSWLAEYLKAEKK